MTNYHELYEFIDESNGDQPSNADQKELAKALYEANATPTSNQLTQAEIEELIDDEGIDLEYSMDTVLGNLIDSKVVERSFPPGPEGYTISERLDDIVNGEEQETLEVDQGNLIEHIQEDHPLDDDGEAPAVADGAGTVRTIVAAKLSVEPKHVEHRLRAGELWDQIGVLNDAIDAIDESEEVDQRDNYGKITYRHVAYRYNLTRDAVDKVDDEEDE